METIPETICGNLVGVGYDSFDKLPKEKNMDRWREVKTGCGLTGPERTQLMNITFPVQQVSTTCLENCGSLAMFWSYIVRGKVKESYYESSSEARGDAGAARSVKLIFFNGHDDDSRACATWGPWHRFSILVEREEYQRCWDLIRSRKKLEYILLQGTKGIGKSVFIYWLIYKLVQAARSPASETTANPLCCPDAKPCTCETAGKLPTFLMITSGVDGGKIYQHLSVADGVPVVRRVSSDVSVDYILSDVEYDLDALNGNWNLNVVSYGASRDPKIFREKMWDAGEDSLEIIMQPCSLEEIQAMYGPTSAASATFSYAVFGGSARMARLLNTLTTGESQQVMDVLMVVRDELVEYFAGSVYADSTALIHQAALVIARMVTVTPMTGGQTEESQAAAVQHSLFDHTYLGVVDTNGSCTTRIDFASTFMSILAGTLVERDELPVLKQLRNVLADSGQRILSEAQVRKTLYEKFRRGGDLRLTRIYPRGYQKTATDNDAEDLRITVNRKVFIRTVEDIARLKENEYGLPILPNFPLVDAVIKVGGDPGYGIELLVTTAAVHRGAVDKHPDIERGMRTPSAANKMVFCCCKENFESFEYVNGLVPDVKQYKMLCEWEVDPGDQAKRRKTGGHK